MSRVRPPTITDNFPSCSVITLPETGESTMSAPFSRTLAASARLTVGLTVLMSMKILPALNPASIPSGPSVIAAMAAAVGHHGENEVGSAGHRSRRVSPLHSFFDQPLRFGAGAVVTGHGVTFAEQPVHHLAAHHSETDESQVSPSAPNLRNFYEIVAL